MNVSTVNQFSEKNPAFTPGALRALRFNCDTNGFNEAFVKVGRRVLIDEEQFFKAIEKMNSKGVSA